MNREDNLFLDLQSLVMSWSRPGYYRKRDPCRLEEKGEKSLEIYGGQKLEAYNIITH